MKTGRGIIASKYGPERAIQEESQLAHLLACAPESKSTFSHSSLRAHPHPEKALLSPLWNQEKKIGQIPHKKIIRSATENTNLG